MLLRKPWPVIIFVSGSAAVHAVARAAGGRSGARARLLSGADWAPLVPASAWPDSAAAANWWLVYDTGGWDAAQMAELVLTQSRQSLRVVLLLKRADPSQPLASSLILEPHAPEALEALRALTGSPERANQLLEHAVQPEHVFLPDDF